ncbi:S10 family peptidase [Granulicella aggregans]|uniref:S10 family peptidase n=1 Tax=Granulicella aggregans TaxID=474949 RepID=UPI0021E07712|nr:peptidase S10 [Granulicella aggregans]
MSKWSRSVGSLVAAAVLTSTVLMASAEDKKSGKDDKKDEKVVVSGTPADKDSALVQDSVTEGSVTLAAGGTVSYRAVAGTLTVGATDQQDAMLGLDGKLLPDSGEKAPDKDKPGDSPATARIFYTAYFKKVAAAENRPVTFLYNGGPGSATMWLHMGSFGPRRVLTTDTEHDAAAPYKIVNNTYTLLDVSDLVFIDAPGTGFSRIFGKDKEKAFWGTDPDAHAFERFIRRFLTKYDRWNSPKYLFGESYGTPRSAVLSADLQNVDLNGIVLLSAILSFDNSIDGPVYNPGVDQAYALGLPTFAATAYYHHKLPTQPAALEPFLAEVEKFALGEYMTALLQGSDLTDAQKQAIAEKLHGYTGLPVAYLLKANLRVSGGQFSKELQTDQDTTTGRLDSRYKGPDIDPLSENADYDPQSNAISSAYTTAINAYMRNDLKFGKDWTYKPGAYTDSDFQWDLRHQAPGGPPVGQGEGGTNVMPDLAYTMKSNPKTKVFLAGGYYDLATPYFEGKYEMHHLPIPAKLQANISYHYYQAGHMIYVNDNVLHQFHDDLAAFIKSTESAH